MRMRTVIARERAQSINQSIAFVAAVIAVEPYKIAGGRNR